MSDAANSPRPTIAVSLTVKNGQGGRAIEFYQRAFGAEVIERYDESDGGVEHATLRFGNAVVYLSEESEEWQAFALPPGVMAPCLFAFRCEDASAALARTLEAGARALVLPTGGDRDFAVVLDPFGYRWTFHQPRAAG